jgi:hypothetical protein
MCSKLAAMPALMLATMMPLEVKAGEFVAQQTVDCALHADAYAGSTSLKPTVTTGQTTFASNWNARDLSGTVRDRTFHFEGYAPLVGSGPNLGGSYAIGATTWSTFAGMEPDERSDTSGSTGWMEFLLDFGIGFGIGFVSSAFLRNYLLRRRAIPSKPKALRHEIRPLYGSFAVGATHPLPLSRDEAPTKAPERLPGKPDQR